MEGGRQPKRKGGMGESGTNLTPHNHLRTGQRETKYHGFFPFIFPFCSLSFGMCYFFYHIPDNSPSHTIMNVLNSVDISVFILFISRTDIPPRAAV